MRLYLKANVKGAFTDERPTAGCWKFEKVEKYASLASC